MPAGVDISAITNQGDALVTAAMLGSRAGGFGTMLDAESALAAAEQAGARRGHPNVRAAGTGTANWLRKSSTRNSPR